MHVELVATDGKTQRRMLWVDVIPNGVSTGFCEKGRDRHTTYHADGNVYSSFLGGKPKKLMVLPTFNDLRGWRQLCAFSLSNISCAPSTPYKLNKLDAIVNVDVRNYEAVGCMLFVVEPNNLSLIGEMLKGFPQGLVTETHSFLKCKPWISIVLHESG